MISGVYRDAFSSGALMKTARICHFGLVALLAWSPACAPAPAPPSEAEVKAVVIFLESS